MVKETDLSSVEITHSGINTHRSHFFLFFFVTVNPQRCEKRENTPHIVVSEPLIGMLTRVAQW